MSDSSEAFLGSALLFLLAFGFFVLSGDMPDWMSRIVRRLSFRTAVGTIATAIFVRGIAVIPDRPSLAMYMCLVGTFLGGVVLAAVVVAHRHFSWIRDELGSFLVQADELMNRDVTTQPAYDDWVADLNRWYQTTNRIFGEPSFDY